MSLYVLFGNCYSQLLKLENHLPVSFLFLLLEKSLINKRYKSMQNNTPSTWIVDAQRKFSTSRVFEENWWHSGYRWMVIEEILNIYKESCDKRLGATL